MIAYHGSNSNFSTLRISKTLVKSSATLLTEGLGIYFSLNREVSATYGKYLYTLEINDKRLIDFNKPYVCRKYVASMVKYAETKTGVQIAKHLDIMSIVDYMTSGQLTISRLHDEIELILDSKETFYFSCSDKKKQEIHRALKEYSKNKLDAYLFSYNILNVGIIKNVDAQVVRILKKEKLK